MAKRSNTAALVPADSDGNQEGNGTLPDRMEFTKARLDNLLKTGRPHRQKTIWDTKETGLSVLISRGPKHKRQATVTLRVVYYLKDKPGVPRYVKIGRYPDDTYTYPYKGADKQAIVISCSDIEAVRRAASDIRNRAKDQGVDPKRKTISGDFAEVVDRFIDEHAKHNRTGQETKRILDLYVVPEWADKNIESITKTDVSALLNRIADGKIRAPNNGKKLGTPAVARAVRAQLVTLFNWYVDDYGSDEFRSPIVKTKKTKQWKPDDRERVLADDEIRALWTACGDMGAYGAAVKSALLTAQRFRKVGQMRRADLKERIRIQGRQENGHWVPESEIGHVWDATRDDDPKNKRVSVVPLSRLAREIIAAVPMVDADKGKDFLFTTTGQGPLKGWSKYKERLDGKMLALLRQWAAARSDDPETVELKPWQHRDLRRTARTFMSRMGVDSKIAEHALAHVPPGVEKVYDRHHYLPEKREAFEKLAELVERIVNPPTNNVMPFSAPVE
jgi:integrase